MLRSLFLLLLIVATGCGGGGGGSTASAPAPVAPVVDNCAAPGQKDFVKQVADAWYLWYRELASVDSDDYATANEYLAALTNPLVDDGRDPGYSYVTTKAEDEAALSSGAYVGFGFRYDVLAGNRFFLADVLQGSPADDAGLARGVEVLAIDMGEGFETINELAEREATLEEIFGPIEVDVERLFRVLQSGSERDVVLVKRELTTPPLAVDPLLIERPGLSPVGYLNLRQFISTAEEPLNEAMATFADAGVTDLVVDFRYNGGGLLTVSEQVLNLLGGRIAEGRESFRISHNDKNTTEDETWIFSPLENSLEPLRIAFVTTEYTASASELVINGLAPEVELVLVGRDTRGKAVGQYAFDQEGCDTRLRLVAFELVNGQGQGGYYNGLASTGRFTLCAAGDDVTRAFGDPGESSLDAALSWLNAGQCPANTSVSASRRAVESKPWALRDAPDLVEAKSLRWQ